MFDKTRKNVRELFGNHLNLTSYRTNSCKYVKFTCSGRLPSKHVLGFLTECKINHKIIELDSCRFRTYIYIPQNI